MKSFSATIPLLLLINCNIVCSFVTQSPNPSSAYDVLHPVTSAAATASLSVGVGTRRGVQTSLSAGRGVSPGSKVLLIGPGFLQLNIAKAAKKAGLKPIVIAPQRKLDSFAQYINDDEIMSNALIGLPDEKDDGVESVVFCSEEAVFGTSLVDTIMSWDGFAGGEIKRAIACVPMTSSIQKDKSMGWMPVFNNDNKEEKVWLEFSKKFQSHPVAGEGSLIRFGSLWGGSVDGPSELLELGLDECIYKMSLENYRDLKERSFDRFRLGGQVLLGDAANPISKDRIKLEENCLNGEELEAFRIQGGYPEQDRVNRHTLASAVVYSLFRDTSGSFTMGDGADYVPREFTILSKSLSSLPSESEWSDMFANPGPAAYPDPKEFVMPEIVNQEES